MHHSILTSVIFFILVAVRCNVVAQSLSPSLPQISEQVETYIQKSRGWKHQTADPPTPPGSRPSADVIIHFWSSEKCLSADVRINGRDYGTKPVPCRIKLAITQAPSAIDAETRLRDSAFNSLDGDFVRIDVGDKGYLWQGSIIIFIKGRFTFTLSGGADLKVGDFSISREFIEKLAQDISTSVTAQ